ncbi:MFS transporter [Herbaspirillum sp. alder98]|uniref:MFS transporter n=1 Tax=Herbaspirillum sp. alder98 TaxID=2913096 RepID=UPI001CD8E2EB|nr:MFS transporter [Herbaspirillum sp. alder98]MCA1325110.1 MFS transporter [Herbaspirillum sp. alder98]
MTPSVSMPQEALCVPPRGLAIAQFALALGGFAIGTAEFAAMGLLPDMAKDLQISVPFAGHLISAYALGVVVGAPLITVAFARMQKRTMLIMLMLLYGITNGATVFLGGAGTTIVSRFFAGLPHGAYFGMAALAAAALVPPNHRGTAIARVMLGLSVANVIGVPAATWLGQHLGWRACFATVAIIAFICAGMIAYSLPKIPMQKGASARAELGALKNSQVLLTLLAGAIGFGGIFSVYSYVSSTLTEVTHVSASFVPWGLACIGIGMVVGNTVIGGFIDRWLKPTMIGGYLFIAVVLVLFAIVASDVRLVLPVLFCVGFGTACTTAFQARLMDVAGEAQSLAAALNHSAFNIANALGAWLGGLAVTAGFGWESTGWVGAILAMLGVLVLWVTFASQRRPS